MLVEVEQGVSDNLWIFILLSKSRMIVFLFPAY